MADTDALAALLHRVEVSPAYRSALTRWCKRIAPKFTVEVSHHAVAELTARVGAPATHRLVDR